MALNEKEFDKLFQENKNLVFRTARLILGNNNDAEDVLQEVFIKVFKLWNSYDPQKGKLENWLYRITCNECATKHRKNKYSYSLDEMQEVGFNPVDQNSNINDEVLVKCLAEQVLIHLKANQRAILTLRFFNDLTYEEIAEILDVPLGTVKSSINRAINILKENAAKAGIQNGM